MKVKFSDTLIQGLFMPAWLVVSGESGPDHGCFESNIDVSSLTIRPGEDLRIGANKRNTLQNL